MSKKKIFIAIALFIIVVVLLKADYKKQDQDVNAPASSLTLLAQEKNIPYHDCKKEDCSTIGIQNHEAFTLANNRKSNFYGFADPSIRKDPNSNTLWLSYSWPNINTENNPPVPGVDVHLASSVDNGKTWQYEGFLWKSSRITDPVSGEKGYISHEISNIVPVTRDGMTEWYGVRLDYFVPEKGGYKRRPSSSFQIKLTKAQTPIGLSQASEVLLGSANTPKEWNMSVNLSQLNKDVNNCKLWTEPALHYDNTKLFLVLKCMRSTLVKRPLDHDNSDYVVFSAFPSSTVQTMQWEYKGLLAKGSIGKELGGHGISQMDIVEDKQGKLLAILTPDSYNSELSEFIHHGCRVIEIEDLDNPGVKRTEDGELIVRAIVNASDQAPYGPGACTYNPYSETGIIMTRREIGKAYMYAFIHATHLHP